MTDLIQRTITVTDPSIAAEIAEDIGMHSISGADFLDLNKTDLRKWVHFIAQELNESFILMQVVERQRPGL
jgi:hypothetical protein